jgi:hypothetical protein
LGRVDLDKHIWPSKDPSTIKADGQRLIWFKAQKVQTYVLSGSPTTTNDDVTLAFYQLNANGQIILIITDNVEHHNGVDAIVLDLNQAWEISMILDKVRKTKT